MINNINNVPTFTKAQNTNFTSEKQGSEGIYMPHIEQTQDANNNGFKQIYDNAENEQPAKYADYYNMFVASQKLQKSEVINNYNYQMYLKKYA